MKAENIIEVKRVKKIYRMGSERITAVEDVSFTIQKGEFCCLFGASGSGKSTLLNLMAGIEKTSGGQITIKGKNINHMNEKKLAKFRQNNLGFVFQSYNLMNAMTALENVELPLIFKRIPAKRRKKMAKDMLTKVGLKNRLKHRPKQMSGGQQQRVGIARAFVGNPEIVFADEPTGNLDSKTSKEVMDLIKGMAKDNKQTIVMVTHDRRLAQYADKIIHIFDGRVEEIELVHSDEEVTGQIMDSTNQETSENVMEQMTEITSENISENISEDLSEQMIEEISEGISKQISQEVQEPKYS